MRTRTVHPVREDELLDRRTLVQAAALRSFTATARAQHVEVSTVTRLVERIERGLGKQLFVRTSRGVGLTAAGTLYVAHAAQVLRAEEAVRAQIDAAGSAAPLLRIAAPVFVAQRIVPIAIAALATHHPGTRIQVHASDAPADPADFELVLRVGATGGQRVGDVRSILVAAPALVRRRRFAHPRELAALPCVAAGEPTGALAWHLRNGRVGVTVPIEPVVRSNDVEVLVELVARGIGIALLPACAVVGRGLVPLCPRWQARSPLTAVHDGTRGSHPRRTLIAALAKATRS